MKKLINRPDNVVEEMLQGLSVLHPGSVRLSGHKVMLRNDAEHVRGNRSPSFPLEAAAMSRRTPGMWAPAC
jgi:hypothetical protein